MSTTTIHALHTTIQFPATSEAPDDALLPDLAVCCACLWPDLAEPIASW